MNLLVIGSKSVLAKGFIDKYKNDYDKIIKTDFIDNTANDENYFKLDLNNPEEINAFSSFLYKKNVIIDKVLFTSGINYMNNLYSLNREQWNKTMNVNVTSFLFIVKGILNFFNNNVSIVVLSSQNGVVAHESRIDYGASKATLIHLVKLLSIEFSEIKDKDIRINAISPSYIKNERNKAYLKSWKGQKLLNRIPYKTFVEVEDVVNAIDFLLSEKSKAIRGHNLIIDYGYTIV